MVSSYSFAQQFDPVSVLQNALGALWGLLRTLAIVLGLAVGLGAVFALGSAVVAVVALCWLTICQVVGGMAIIAAFAWLTYPRSKAVR